MMSELPPTATTAIRWLVVITPPGPSDRNLTRQCGDRLREARERRARHAGTDLPDAGFAMCDARIDYRQDAGVDHFARIDAGRRAPEIERRKREAAIAAERDMGHRHGVGHRVLSRATDELHVGRRRGHGEAAEARRFGNGTVTEIRCGIRDAVAREIKAVDDRCRSREPLLTGTAQANGEIDAIAAHGGDHAAAAN